MHCKRLIGKRNNQSITKKSDWLSLSDQLCFNFADSLYHKYYDDFARSFTVLFIDLKYSVKYIRYNLYLPYLPYLPCLPYLPYLLYLFIIS